MLLDPNHKTILQPWPQVLWGLYIWWTLFVCFSKPLAKEKTTAFLVFPCPLISSVHDRTVQWSKPNTASLLKTGKWYAKVTPTWRQSALNREKKRETFKHKTHSNTLTYSKRSFLDLTLITSRINTEQIVTCIAGSFIMNGGDNYFRNFFTGSEVWSGTLFLKGDRVGPC